MSLITIIWSMLSSACLTLAGINLQIWCKNPKARANLLFSLAAVSTAAFAFCELWMMRAETTTAFATALKWAPLPGWLVSLSLVGFVRLYLRAGRPWLAWTVYSVRTLALLLNFMVGQNIIFMEITHLRHIPFLGETVSVAEGVRNPWMLVGQLGLVLLVIFVADAGVTAWRRGNRRTALTVGGSVVFFTIVATGQSLLVFWGIVQAPITASLFFFGVVAVMGYELSYDALRASQLDRELKVSQAGLRESEERMNLAVEGAHFGIWIRDLVRNEIWATDNWRALFGFKKAERLELDSILRRIHPDDQDAVRMVLAKAIENNGSYEAEYRLILPTGEMRWIASHGRVEYVAGGKPILIRGVSHDITERKVAEQETQNLRDEIAHAGRVSMMGQLASALAHEINQPLGAILRNAEAAELFLQNASPDLDEIRAILDDIKKDDQRAGSVIDRMGGLLKRHNLEARRIDVGEVIGDVVSLVQADAVARRVRLDVEIQDDLPLVYADRVHLQQVLINLIFNGMDALNKGGLKDPRVRVTAQLDGARAVEITVSDDGHGIPADKLVHIFDPFFTTKPNGMGMGLPISRTIIEAHGGRIWAENNNGGGAVFRFTLPILDEAVTK